MVGEMVDNMEHAAIQATFATYKFIQSRRVMQIILEVPMEHASHVTQALGYPMPGVSTWVAVARLNINGEAYEPVHASGESENSSIAEASETS